jgi:hypothetical protein
VIGFKGRGGVEGGFSEFDSLVNRLILCNPDDSLSTRAGIDLIKIIL